MNNHDKKITNELKMVQYRSALSLTINITITMTWGVLTQNNYQVAQTIQHLCLPMMTEQPTV